MNVAVIACCYKRPKMTQICLGKALQHCGYPSKWYFCDDGSQDETAKILARLCRKDDVLDVNKKNLGMYVRRNELFRRALEDGADAIVNIDNDVLVPQFWLHDMVKAFEGCEFAVGSVWFVNDVTANRMINKALGRLPKPKDSHRWVNTGGCGSTCAIHHKSIFDKGIWYEEKRQPWTYGDGILNAAVTRAGFSVGIYLGVQAWRLEHIVWTDVDYEEKKLGIRHKHRHKSEEGFEISLERESRKVVHE